MAEETSSEKVSDEGASAQSSGSVRESFMRQAQSLLGSSGPETSQRVAPVTRRPQRSQQSESSSEDSNTHPYDGTVEEFENTTGRTLSKPEIQEQLAKGSGDMSMPQPMSQTSSANKPFMGGKSKRSFETITPPEDDFRLYWQIFESTPIVSSSINSFANQVVEPGYYLNAPVLSDEEYDNVISWLERAAILENQIGEDIINLIRKMVVQRAIKGTVFLEKVYGSGGNITDEKSTKKLADRGALKFIHPETVTAFTRPNQSILIQPKDQFEGVIKNKAGKSVAYAQGGKTGGKMSVGGGGKDSYDVTFTVDDIIKLSRNADIGELFGTSRLEQCATRIEGLKQKLLDNDDAIASKAFPLWLFLFGEPEQPWDRSDIQNFMQAHEMDNFHAGLKQGVRGDVSVETISGEVADIAESLDFDVDWIMSAMPTPKYELGSFDTGISTREYQAHETSVQRQLKQTRREIETALTPFVRQRIREKFGLSDEDAELVKFKLGRPEQEKKPLEPGQQTLRYEGVKSGQQQDPNDDSQPVNPQAPSGRPSSERPSKIERVDPTEKDSGSSEQNGQGIMDVDLSEVPEAGVKNSEAQLAEGPVVSTDDPVRRLATLLADVLGRFRDETVMDLESEYGEAPRTATYHVEGLTQRNARNALDKVYDQRSVESLVEDVVQNTVAALGEDDTSTELQVEYSARHRQAVDNATANLERATRDVLDNFADKIVHKVKNGARAGDTMETILEQIRDGWPNDNLGRRGRIMAQMELQRLISSTKIDEFDRADDVVGVRAVHPTERPATQMCHDLAGRVARFDEGALVDQWKSYTERDPHGSYRLLGRTPPFHYGCELQLIPVTEASLQEDDKPRSTEQLAAKYNLD